jgi:type II secretory pathway component PulF
MAFGRKAAVEDRPDLGTFQYTAVSQTGERVKAKMQAPDADAVAAALAAEGWVPLKVTPISSGGLNFDVAKLAGRGGLRLKPGDLAAFTRQLHQLLRAGVAVPRTLAALGEEADPRLTQMCLDISDQVSAGTPLSDAFAAYPDIFDNVFCSYIAAGEEAGTLVQSTGRLATLLEKEAQLRNKIKSATAYPKMASIAIGVLVMGILLFMVPGFQGIYRQFNAPLPAPTRGLLALSALLNPLHPQIGSIDYANVPLKGDSGTELTAIPIIEDTIDVSWKELQEPWDPQTAPTNAVDPQTGKMAKRTLVEEDKMTVFQTWLVVKSTYVNPENHQTIRQGLGVLEVCPGNPDAVPPVPSRIGTPTPPYLEGEGKDRRAVPCKENETLVISKSVTQRYGEVITNPGLDWLNPATWLRPLQQPNRSLWTSPINFFSPTLYLIIALYFTRRFLKKHRDDLDIGEVVDRIRFKMPIFGAMNKRIAMFRWASTLAGALEAGVQTHKALEIAGRASGSRWIRKATIEVQEGVRSGRAISAGLSDYKDLFPPNIRALVATGEQTGELDTLLDSAALTLDEEINAIISGLAARIEVVLIITMGVVVGGIVIVLYLPIFNLAVVTTEGLGNGSFLPPLRAPWRIPPPSKVAS